MQETWAQSLGWEDPLEKEMSTHPSILAWEIPRTEEPGGPEFMGSQSQTRLSDSTTTTILFSVVTVPIYILTNSVGGFPSLHTLSSICYL